MLKVAVYNQEGKQVKDTELNELVFGIEPNNQAIFDMVLLQRASWRQGTHKVKNRTEVRGGGRKPWRQKGTGRARVGSSRNPVWTGGGVAFAPKPRDYSQSINKKMRRLAMKSVFSAKASDKELFIIDELKLEAPKTKVVVDMFKNLNINKTLVVIDENDVNVVNSVRNIKDAKCSTVGTLNAYEMLKYNNLVLTKDALNKIEEVYK